MMHIQNLEIIKQMVAELEAVQTELDNSSPPHDVFEDMRVIFEDQAFDIEHVIADETQRYFWLPNKVQASEENVRLKQDIDKLIEIQLKLLELSEEKEAWMIDCKQIIAPLKEMLK